MAEIPDNTQWPKVDVIDLSDLFCAKEAVELSVLIHADAEKKEIADLSDIFYAPGSLEQPRSPRGAFHPHNPRTIAWQGYQIAIENPAGSIRRGVGPDGKPWKTTMGFHYGEIMGIAAEDSQPMDAFVGMNLDAPNVYAVRIVDAHGDQCLEETKLVIGATSKDEARQVIIDHYSGDALFFESATEIPVIDFAAWVTSSCPVRQMSDVGAVLNPSVQRPASRVLCANCANLVHEPISLMEQAAIEALAELSESAKPESKVMGESQHAQYIASVLNKAVTNQDLQLRERKRPAAKLKRDTETPYWPTKVALSEKHINFSAIDRLHRHSQDRLRKVLGGKNKARLIRTIAQQAIEQKHGGRRSTQMQFHPSHELAAAVRVEVSRVYDQARKQVKDEVARQVKKGK